MRRLLTLTAILGILVIPAAIAVVPTSALQSALTSVNGTADQSGNFDNRQKTFNTAVRNNFTDVQTQLNALQARIDALENPPAPAEVTVLAPLNGQTVSGVANVRASVPAGTDWLGIFVCGGLSGGEDHVADAPNEFSVQWDTKVCPNGDQGVDVWAFDDDGSNYGNQFITVNVQNGTPPPPPPPVECASSAEPGPIAGLGYTVRFSDCFDVLSPAVWCSHQWWEPVPVLGTQYVQDGILNVVSRRVDGYPNNTVSSEPCGQSSPKSFKQGYMEARMKWTAGNGSSPAFWLFSTRYATNPNWPER